MHNLELEQHSSHEVCRGRIRRMGKTMASRLTLSEYLTKTIEISEKSQKQIAHEAG